MSNKYNSISNSNFTSKNKVNLNSKSKTKSQSMSKSKSTPKSQSKSQTNPKSKSIPKPSESTDVDTNVGKYDYIGSKYIHMVLFRITEALEKSYGYDNKTAVDLAKEIGRKAAAKLEEKYFVLPMSKEFFHKTANRMSFQGWMDIVYMIPLCQSLGDTLGYNNGKWEFNYDDPNAGPEYVNELIAEFIHLGGINDISITNWKASDDTILYMVTHEVITSQYEKMMIDKNNFIETKIDIDNYGKQLKNAYIESLPLIQNRDPGIVTVNSLNIQKNIEWDRLYYDKSAIGNGSVMRCGCIGILYPGSHNRKFLIALAIESSRITHNSATAILGSIVAALFTAYAVEKIAINLWPNKMLKLLKSGIVDEYMKLSRPSEYELFRRDKIFFIQKWDNYTELLFSGIHPTDMKIMINPVERYKYLKENFSIGCDIAGGCADDCLIMAYHALLQCNGVFEKIVVYSILHPGDSDTVGSVALSWYSAYYTSPKIIELVAYRFEGLEFFDRINTHFMSDEYQQIMVRVFFYDMYLSISMKILKKIVRRD